MATQPRKPNPAPQPATLPAAGFIRLAELRQIIPLGKSSIWRKVQLGEFPRPVKLSANVTAWPVESVRAWIDEQAKGAR